VGQRIGFKQITTTETSSQESIGFLDVGVQLRVRPYISGDNNVLMHVKPEVSSGRINPETGAPDAEIIQVDTDVLLPDGRGMVIGGLIQEEDSTLESKVPVLGNLWLVGRLFQR
jgi:type II secretory pathway component GspD/PulD (secretin)